MELVRFRRCCSYGALICARSDCFSIGNVCHKTGKSKWTGCRGGLRVCDPPLHSLTRTAWSRCDTATRLLLSCHHLPLGSCTGCSLLYYRWLGPPLPLHRPVRCTPLHCTPRSRPHSRRPPWHLPPPGPPC